MPTGAVHVEGLNEFRRALRAMGPQWARRLSQAHKKIASRTSQIAQALARGMGGVQAKASPAIKGRATNSAAKIAIAGGSSLPMANAAFFGAKRHSGWYAKPQFWDGPPQLPEWVGNGWDVGVAGTGPYAINDAIATYMPYLIEDFADMIDEIARDAFPN